MIRVYNQWPGGWPRSPCLEMTPMAFAFVIFSRRVYLGCFAARCATASQGSNPDATIAVNRDRFEKSILPDDLMRSMGQYRSLLVRAWALGQTA